jgi:peptide chain release factor 2
MEEVKKKIEKVKSELINLEKLLNIREKKEIIQKLQLEMASPEFWQKKSQEVIERLRNLKNDVEKWEELKNKLNELEEFSSLDDPSIIEGILKEIEKCEEECDKLRLEILFSGKFDDASAYMEINSGAGGTEACDWASMLFRMYFRWAQNKGFKVKILNEVKGEEAGIKNITFLIEGRRAYGLLKSERGVHRLVRISPFDASKRRHTSFASVDVIPEIKDDNQIEIRPEEIKIETFRASGHGGQHVNVTDSAVRVTHLPTGIVVSCQNERSQYQNKQSALKVLKAKLARLKEEEKRKELEKISGKKMKIEWGFQIRSYILHPYLLVKDHRTNLELSNAWDVLDGNIDEFIYAYLKKEVYDKKNNS